MATANPFVYSQREKIQSQMQLQDIMGKGGVFGESFAALAKEREFLKTCCSIVAVVIVHHNPVGKEFHENV